MDDKHRLRAELRQKRRTHVEALPGHMRALVFHRPPSALVERLPAGAVVGLYHALGPEAPTAGYATWFHERGWRIALPWFAAGDTPMRFRQWGDPLDEVSLTEGPYRSLQPGGASPELVPDVVFVPLVGFTATCARLGQGGGHYDRWLAAHPGAMPIGLAWDCQLVEDMPLEAHDRPLAAVITPTRLYERNVN